MEEVDKGCLMIRMGVSGSGCGYTNRVNSTSGPVSAHVDKHTISVCKKPS